VEKVTMESKTLLLSALTAVEPSKWFESSLLNQPETILTWLPIVGLGSSDCRVGLLGTGEWVIDTGSGLVVLSTRNSAMPLLPCLGSPHDELQSVLTNACTGLGLPAGVAGTFPWHLVVHNAVASDSDFWVGLALNWLETVPPEELPTDALARIANSKQFSQGTRHTARRLMRR
jgi:hypothetical protein